MRIFHYNKYKEEARKDLKNGFFVVALFACLIYLAYEGTGAVITSATVGNRELPIYCVDTTEKKVALSFDAACGGGNLR